MRKFRFNKLVRDNIASNIENNGGIVIQRKLDGAEFLEQLHIKLLEEFNEYTKASKYEVVNELSDVYEVLEAIRTTLNISESELNESRLKKTTKNGAFSKKIYIDYVEIKDDDPWIQYLLDNPDRYPEMF